MNLVEVEDRTRTGLDTAAVARLVATVLDAEGVDGAEVAVTFVGERRMRALNREHRGKDEVTDVLSFPLEDWADGPGAGFDGPPAPAGPPLLLGDVVVCTRRALRQARTAGVPPAFELSVLLVHGALHLLGHDHETDAGRMALRQAEILELVDWEAIGVAPAR